MGLNPDPLHPVTGDPVIQKAVFKKNISTEAKKKMRKSKAKNKKSTKKGIRKMERKLREHGIAHPIKTLGQPMPA